MSNTKLPFGLCERYNIKLPDKATPQDAWDALEGETGITPDMFFDGETENERAAIDFGKQDVGKVYYSSKNDRYMRYDSKSNKFVSVDKDGIIHTFMIFDNSKRFEKLKIQGEYYEL